MSDRKAVEGAIDFAVANKATEPTSRLAGAGWIQGVARDYNAGRIQNTNRRLGAKGWILGKLVDEGA